MPSVLVATPVFDLRATRFWGQGKLPQDLVSADVLRECSQLRDAGLRAVDGFDGGDFIRL